MSTAFSHLIAAVLGVALDRALGHPIDHLLVRPVSRAWRRRTLRKLDKVTALSAECAVIAGTTIFVHQFSPSGISHQHITARVAHDQPTLAERLAVSPRRALLPDAADMTASIEGWRHRLEEDPHLWNGVSLAVRSCDVSRTPDDEDTMLAFTFAELDYATACAVEDAWTALDLQTRRNIDGENLRRVDGFLSHGFGLNCTVETADGLCMITQRSTLAKGWEGHSHIAFNEGLSRVDRTPGGGVDLLGAFARGLREELGVDSEQIPDFRQRLMIHTVMLDLDRYQWGLLAHLNLLDTEISSTSLRIARNLGGATDDWEASGVRFIPFTSSPKAVLEELRRPANWVSHGLLNLALSAISRHPHHAEQIRRALTEASG